MESLTDKIKRFLAVGDGSGDGYGDGSGDGYGDGSGSGSGAGSGSWKEYDGKPIYYIDDVPTLITSVRGNAANGFIIGNDLRLRPCYIARCGDSFAHGDTLHGAVRDATAKALEDEPLEERIAKFVKAHPDADTPYGDLFRWHHILTGSCEAGRKEWCRTHGHEPTDSITVREFIEGTVHEYGVAAIRELAQAYGITID